MPRVLCQSAWEVRTPTAAVHANGLVITKTTVAIEILPLLQSFTRIVKLSTLLVIYNSLCDLRILTENRRSCRVSRTLVCLSPS